MTIMSSVFIRASLKCLYFEAYIFLVDIKSVLFINNLNFEPREKRPYTAGLMATNPVTIGNGSRLRDGHRLRKGPPIFVWHRAPQELNPALITMVALNNVEKQ